jgi:hypothetical protein
VTPSTPFDAELIPFLEKRVTNRRRDALQSIVGDPLREIAHESGAMLEIVSDRAKIACISEIVAEGDKVRMLDERMHRELMSEVRWTKEEAQSGDGLDLATLELPAADIAGLRMLRRPSVVRAIRDVRGGDGLKKMTRKSFEAASLVALLRFADSDVRRAHLLGGQALERVWLRANARGIAVHPMTPFFFFLPRDKPEVLRERFDEAFPPMKNAYNMILVRLGIAGPPTARSLRKPLEAILTVD